MSKFRRYLAYITPGGRADWCAAALLYTVWVGTTAAAIAAVIWLGFWWSVAIVLFVIAALSVSVTWFGFCQEEVEKVSKKLSS